MKKLLAGAFAALLSLSVAAAAQTTNPPAASQNDNTNASAAKKRGPVFRATKDQIKQAQTLLKGRGLYAGEATGKLDTDTRAALKKSSSSGAPEKPMTISSAAAAVGTAVG